MRIKTIRKAVGIILSASLIASAFPVYAEETQTPSSYSIEAEEEAATLDQLGTEEDIQDELEIETETGAAAPDSMEAQDDQELIVEEPLTEEAETEEEIIDIEQIESPSFSEAGKSIEVSIEDNCMAVILASGYEIPADAKEISVAVWSDVNGQDDLKWYKLEKTSDGLKTRINLYDHAEKDGSFLLHFYYKSSAGKMVCFATEKYESEDVFTTKLTYEETEKGYRLFLDNPTKTPSKAEFAIWSEANGQDDLKWYACSYEAEKRRAICDWDLGNLKDTGTILIHSYIKDNSGKMIYQGAMKLEIAKPEIGSIEAVFDEESGDYLVTLSDINNGSAISRIQVPTWSESNQGNLVWQEAKRNSDGSWTVKANISDHGSKSGSYQVHVYITDRFGLRFFAGRTEFTVDASSIKTRTEEKVSDSGICEIRALNYKALETAKNVRVAFWSDQNGQDDLKWYSLSRKEEKTEGGKDIVWYANIDLKNHGAVNGRYLAHIYYDNSKGNPVCISPYSFTVSNLFKLELKAVEKDGQYRITLSNPTITPKSVVFAIWSDEKGQDDLKWYDVSYNEKSREATLIWKGEGLKHSGQVIIHCYAKNSSGKMVYQAQTKVEIKTDAPEVSKLEAAFTKSTGAFKVKASGITGTVTKMVAAVWADEKQADLKWYGMTASDSGEWTVSGNISNHGYRTGNYNVHLYVTDAFGKQTFGGKTAFNAEQAGQLEIRTVHANHTYQAAVTGINTKNIKSVSVAVWSSANGQDDLKWYTTVKSGNEYVVNIPIINHKTLGNYVAHAYVNRTDGTSYNTANLQNSFTVDAGVSSELSYIDRQTDNGTFLVSAEVYGYLKVKEVNFTVWTEKDGEDDQETITAVQQSDGSWAAVVNPARHSFESGVYLISGSGLFEDGSSFSIQNGSYEVSSSNEFYTVVASEEEAVCMIQGYKDRSNVYVKVWSINGGNDDLKTYPAQATETGWKAIVLKANHGSAGQYKAELYVDGVLLHTDTFSFDQNRLSDSWYSISTAHAAGGQGSNKSEIYTNCLSAMTSSYKAGYRTFEIDVLLTSDGEPVLFHTWTTNILDHYSFSAETSDGPTYKEFMSDTMYGGKYKTSDYRNLLTYLMEHPDVKVLLDTKYRTSEELHSFYQKLYEVANSMNAVSAMKNQIIPYFFYGDQLTAIRSVCAFREYHYATYAAFPQKIGVFSTGDFETVLQFCKMNNVLSVSMWDSLATAELIRMADSMGITVYVHTTDDPSTASRLLNLGAAGIITNSITPVQAVAYIS